MKDKKQIIHEAGASSILIILFSLILFFMVYGSRKSWNNGLEQMTEKVLNDYVGAEYSIKGSIPVQTPLSVSAAVFELEKNNNLKSVPAYAVLIRAYGIAGALPLVYVFDDDDVFFAGMGGLENKTATYTDTGLFGYGLTAPIIEFWQKRAQALIPPKETEDEKGAAK
ncbi:MAG: hypothetical protein IKQ84_08610 [Spirochaetaceae bacterium]|nr:hypothetical protein [Spirochaetaceae bacterium]